MEKELQKFLTKHHKTDKDFEKTGYKWEELIKIAEDYEESKRDLEPVAKSFVERIKELPEVHSVWYRLKDTEHLIEKIIRKRIEDIEKNSTEKEHKIRNITYENYKSEITDLIGIRILHLYKEDWLSIHKFICHLWDIEGNPIAYIRKGDDESYIKEFEEHGCKLKKDKPYRSVHYLIKSQPYKEVFTSEIQVRTIFDEGWSAIDHDVLYPTGESQVLKKYLSILNRLTGSADEMGSFVKFLKNDLEKRESEARKQKMEIKKVKKELIKLRKNNPDAADSIEKSLDPLFSYGNDSVHSNKWIFNTIDSDALINDSYKTNFKITPVKPIEFFDINSNSINSSRNFNKHKKNIFLTEDQND